MTYFSSLFTLLVAASTAWSPIVAMASEAAASGEEGGAKGGLPQFDATTFPSQLFWLMLSFGIFFYLMQKFFVPKIGARIEQRDGVVKKNLQLAEGLVGRGKNLEKELEEKLSIARATARNDVANTMATIVAGQEAALKEFQKKSDALLAESNHSLEDIKIAIGKEKASMVSDLKKEIVNKIFS